jgi:cell fate regulator YaaT (PSP1 superfamily)
MGCGSGGCGTGTSGVPAGCNSNGSCGTADGCNKLTVFDWLGNMSLPEGQQPFDIVEVRFKNSRKDFFKNVNGLSLNVGDPVAVEASSGHDMGTVSLTGELVRLQLKKRNVNFDSEELKKIYRKAKQTDLDKWTEARALEVNTMYTARTIALRLGLEMKLSDVEFQGDKSKAIFYYTADARVDFRELIKVLAEEFKVRIEMRQIGARQEASRLGGIGSCGRELCCSTWLTDFRTVNTSAARYQQLSLNPLKLAGQCGKLKCCLNYELDSYLDALKDFPDMDGKRLLTKKGEAFLQKTDIFRKMMWFSYRSEPGVLIPMSVEAVNQIVELNANGEQAEELIPTIKNTGKLIVAEPNFENVVGQDSLTRFDRKPKQKSQQNQRNNNQRKPQAAGGQKNQNARPQQKPQGQEGEGVKPQNPQNRPPQNKRPANQQNAGGAKPQQNKPQQNKLQNRDQQKPPQNREQSGEQKNQAQRPNKNANRSNDRNRNQEGKPQNKPNTPPPNKDSNDAAT